MKQKFCVVYFTKRIDEWMNELNLVQYKLSKANERERNVYKLFKTITISISEYIKLNFFFSVKTKKTEIFSLSLSI